MNYYSLTEMEMMNYYTQITIHRLHRLWDGLHGFSGTGRYSLWSAHVETRRATSPRGKHSDAKCLNYELGDYMRTMIYLRSSQSRRDFVY